MIKEDTIPIGNSIDSFLKKNEVFTLSEDEVKRDFSKKNFSIIRNLLNPEVLSFLQWYYEESFRVGRWVRKDHQCQNRYGIYDDPIAKAIQGKAQDFVRDILGFEVRKYHTTCFLYFNNASLEEHIDRTELEYTLLINLISKGKYRWPIYFSDEQIILNPGDAVFYKHLVRHSRNALQSGEQVGNLLMHFISISTYERLKKKRDLERKLKKFNTKS